MDDVPAIAEFTRVYLAVFFSFVAAFYTVRIVRMKKAVGQELVFPGSLFCSTWWNHMMFRFFRVVIWMVCLWRVFFPSIDACLGLFESYQHFTVILIGNVLLTLGFAFTIAVHFSLATGWRSGVDPDGPAKLVSTGAYAFSRNPMFLGVAIAQAGFFLALPSVFSLVCLCVGLLMLHRQVKAEERHLSAQFPLAYAAYAARVRRWL